MYPTYLTMLQMSLKLSYLMTITIIPVAIFVYKTPLMVNTRDDLEIFIIVTFIVAKLNRVHLTIRFYYVTNDVVIAGWQTDIDASNWNIGYCQLKPVIDYIAII